METEFPRQRYLNYRSTILRTAIDSKKPSLVRLILKSKCSLSGPDQTAALESAFRLMLSGDVTKMETATEVFAGLSHRRRCGRQQTLFFSLADFQWLRDHLSELTANEISHGMKKLYAVWPDDHMMALILLASYHETETGPESVNPECDGWTAWQVQAMEECLMSGFKCHIVLENITKRSRYIPFGALLPFLLKYLTINFFFSIRYIRALFQPRQQERDGNKLHRACLMFHLGFFPWTRIEDRVRIDDYFPCCMKENCICPHPLQDLCRGVVRRSLSSNNALIGVRQLPPLPTNLKKFLLLDDIYPFSLAT